MLVVIGGGGSTGTQLAKLLLVQGHEVHVIENRPEHLVRLHKNLPTEVIFEGDPADPATLQHAGIERAHMLAACSSEDAQNLAMCFLAREKYRVPRNVSRITNPRNAWLFDSKFHVDAAVNQSEIMAAIIEEEMSPGSMMTLLKLHRGSYALVEQVVSKGAKADGIEVKDLPLPDNCVIAAILRNGEIVVPRGNTIILSGDEILAVTDRSGATTLANLLDPL